MSPRKWTVFGSILLFSSVVCWFFPLFHVRAMKSGESLQPANNTQIAKEPRKLEAYATGTDVTQLWSAFDSDSSNAQAQYGRQSGLGGAWYFRVKGIGVVDSIEKDRLILSINNSLRRVSIEMGVVVDNTVREAIGVKASDFANSQDFNAVSTELNRQVEQEVIAQNRDRLKLGATVEFVGCSKINGRSDLDPLRLIPIRLQIRENASEIPAGALNDVSGKEETHPTERSP